MKPGERFTIIVLALAIAISFSFLIASNSMNNSWVEIRSCEVACKTHEGLYKIYADGDCVCKDTAYIDRFEAKKIAPY